MPTSDSRPYEPDNRIHTAYPACQNVFSSKETVPVDGQHWQVAGEAGDQNIPKKSDRIFYTTPVSDSTAIVAADIFAQCEKEFPSKFPQY